MIRPYRTVVVLALLLASLWAPSRPATPVAEASTRVPPLSTRRPAIATCQFDVGDIVVRAGIGAAVPARGEAIGGYADGPSGGTEITITTSPAGLVTIDPGGESCQLPS
jgi:hypothetical protein